MSRGRRIFILAGAAIVVLCGIVRALPGRAASSGTRSIHTEDYSVPLVQAKRGSLNDYTGSATTNLFGRAPAPPVVVAKVEPPKPAPAPPAPPPDPLAEYSFTGLVTIDGKTYALVENRATRAGEYLEVGDEIAGFRVASIDREGLTVTRNEEPRTLALNNSFSLTPLSKDAPPQAAKSATATYAADVKAAYEKTFTTRLSLSYFITGENIEKLHDDYYNGKITLDELNQRANSGNKGLLLNWGRSISSEGKLGGVESMIYY